MWFIAVAHSLFQTFLYSRLQIAPSAIPEAELPVTGAVNVRSSLKYRKDIPNREYTEWFWERVARSLVPGVQLSEILHYLWKWLRDDIFLSRFFWSHAQPNCIGENIGCKRATKLRHARAVAILYWKISDSLILYKNVAFIKIDEKDRILR